MLLKEWSIPKRRRRLHEEREADDLAILMMSGSEAERAKIIRNAQLVWRRIYGTLRQTHRKRIDANVKRKWKVIGTPSQTKLDLVLLLASCYCLS